MILLLTAPGFWALSSGCFGLLTTSNSCIHFTLHRALCIRYFTYFTFTTSCGEGSIISPDRDLNAKAQSKDWPKVPQQAYSFIPVLFSITWYLLSSSNSGPDRSSNSLHQPWECSSKQKKTPKQTKANKTSLQLLPQSLFWLFEVAMLVKERILCWRKLERKEKEYAHCWGHRDGLSSLLTFQEA